MLYDYKSDKFVQDVILNHSCELVDDIVEEFCYLHRYEELDIYVPSYLAREIISGLLNKIDELWVHAESKNNLLYDDNEVLITISYDGMIFVEEARGKYGFKFSDDCPLAYVYDGFSKKDIDDLDEKMESILIFGFDDTDDECCCDKYKCDCEKNNNNNADASVKRFYLNGKPVSKEKFDKKYKDLEETYEDILEDIFQHIMIH